MALRLEPTLGATSVDPGAKLAHPGTGSVFFDSLMRAIAPRARDVVSDALPGPMPMAGAVTTKGLLDALGSYGRYRSSFRPTVHALQSPVTREILDEQLRSIWGPRTIFPSVVGGGKDTMVFGTPYRRSVLKITPTTQNTWAALLGRLDLQPRLAASPPSSYLSPMRSGFVDAGDVSLLWDLQPRARMLREGRLTSEALKQLEQNLRSRTPYPWDLVEFHGGNIGRVGPHYYNVDPGAYRWRGVP